MAAPGSNGTDIPVDYHLSKEVLYTRLARALLKRGLIILLWIEAPDRPVRRSASGLPSWVPDYTTQQTLLPLYRYFLRFATDLDFPLVDQEPHFRDADDSDILVLRGIYVGVITGVRYARLTDLGEYEGRDMIKLIKYDGDPESKDRKPAEYQRGYGATILRALNILSLATLYIVYSRILYPVVSRIMDPFFLRFRFLQRPYYLYLLARIADMMETSWGPCQAAVGDIIIVAAGCKVPLALRPNDDGKYLLVGACWLIESRLQLGRLKNGDAKNRGFSPIMVGSACEVYRRTGRRRNFTFVRGW